LAEDIKKRGRVIFLKNGESNLSGLNIIIPLGGQGKRFSEEGYIQPKPLINVLGKPIILWVLDNIKLNPNDIIYLAYHNSLQKANFEDILKRKHPEIVFSRLLNSTKGAAETVQKCIDIIPEERRKLKTVCLDGDTFYSTDILDIIRKTEKNGLICFKDDQLKPIYSYIKVGQNDKIIDIAEKVRISDYANTGCYIFESAEILSEYCLKAISLGKTIKGEYYISMVIKHMIEDEYEFISKLIKREDFHVLGTPYQVKLFSSIKKNGGMIQRFCFDLDNTLVTYPKVDGDYTTCEPINRNIEYLRYLKSNGHLIIIYTARRMRTWSGNIGSVVADIGKITLESLEKFEIPYDEIYFGKPYADFYIDDLAINTQSSLERETGYHKTEISERIFNNLGKSSIETIKKSSSNENALKGEIHWYQNIPNTIKDLFPRYFGISNDGSEFEIEKIHGVPLSYLYLEQLLDENLLVSLLGNLERIHNVKIDGEINIYANYQNKLKHRYDNYDYSGLIDSEKKYNHILQKLQEYEELKRGKMTVIHGDPVFTNIIVRENQDLVFIDMRGELGNEMTIMGDKWYDYAKVYQSLLGYDEILLEKFVDRGYKDNLISIFEKFVENKFGTEELENIQLITNSLLLSLIPLHNNNKISDYYNLITD
jgi:capsule biosynthesis phosphatase